MTDIDPGAGAPEAAAEPGIRILAQFIRDLSFENPRAPDALRQSPDQPAIDLNVEMNARGRDDGLFEVDLKLSARATRSDGPLFIVELLYGGVFQIGVGGQHIARPGMQSARRQPLIERNAKARRLAQRV